MLLEKRTSTGFCLLRKQRPRRFCRLSISKMVVNAFGRMLTAKKFTVRTELQRVVRSDGLPIANLGDGTSSLGSAAGSVWARTPRTTSVALLSSESCESASFFLSLSLCVSLCLSIVLLLCTLVCRVLSVRVRKSVVEISGASSRTGGLSLVTQVWATDVPIDLRDWHLLGCQVQAGGDVYINGCRKAYPFSPGSTAIT